MFSPFFSPSSPLLLTDGYSGLNVTALILIFLWVPETKQRTLEELDYIFAVPTRVHMRYQLFTALPWWIRRYIFRRNEPLEPLYKFEIAPEDREIEA